MLHSIADTLSHLVDDDGSVWEATTTRHFLVTQRQRERERVEYADDTCECQVQLYIYEYISLLTQTTAGGARSTAGGVAWRGVVWCRHHPLTILL